MRHDYSPAVQAIMDRWEQKQREEEAERCAKENARRKRATARIATHRDITAHMRKRMLFETGRW